MKAMLRASLALAIVITSLALRAPPTQALQAPAGTGATANADAAHPTVDEVLARYADARGGAAAWSAVQAMGWTGHVETDTPNRVPVPFLMLFKRPGATRFEVIQQSQRSVRVFDGSHGWRMHPGGERGVQVDDYTTEELTAARDACGLDGPLSEPVRKGVAIAIDGSEPIEGRKAWRLRVTLPSGAVQTHWIDAESFRDLRYTRTARDRAGRDGLLTVWLRGYQQVEGLWMPMQIETDLPDGRLADRLVIEKVAINPVLGADAFSPPDTRPLNIAKHGGVIVNATGNAPGEARSADGR